jgi:hypothetical protein
MPFGEPFDQIYILKPVRSQKWQDLDTVANLFWEAVALRELMEEH